jgi:hypothetical protein
MPNAHKLKEKLEEIFELKHKGHNNSNIARQLSKKYDVKVSPQSIDYHIKKAQENGVLKNAIRNAKKKPATTLVIASQRPSPKTNQTDDSSRLSELEKSRLKECLECIDHGLQSYVKMGQALATIRDEKLYRETHNTFEDFASEVVVIARARAYQLIENSSVYLEMSKILDISEPSLRMPARESHIAELARIKSPKMRMKIWTAVLKENNANKSSVTAEVLHRAVRDRLPKSKALSKSRALSLNQVATQVQKVIGQLQNDNLDDAMVTLKTLAQKLPKPKAIK